MRHAVLPKIREKSLSWGEEPWASPLFHSPPSHHSPPVMMDNQDLRPELIAQTYAHASPSSLPTHP